MGWSSHRIQNSPNTCSFMLQFRIHWIFTYRLLHTVGVMQPIHILYRSFMYTKHSYKFSLEKTSIFSLLQLHKKTPPHTTVYCSCTIRQDIIPQDVTGMASVSSVGSVHTLTELLNPVISLIWKLITLNMSTSTLSQSV